MRFARLRVAAAVQPEPAALNAFVPQTGHELELRGDFQQVFQIKTGLAHGGFSCGRLGAAHAAEAGDGRLPGADFIAPAEIVAPGGKLQAAEVPARQQAVGAARDLVAAQHVKPTADEVAVVVQIHP